MSDKDTLSFLPEPEPIKKDERASVHAGRMLFALARYFDWYATRMIPECELDGLREDLVIVSRSGYATVVEIKVSRSDWQADRYKARWPSKSIARFFYAVPLDLYESGIPAHVPGHCGLLALHTSEHGYDSISEKHAARRLPAAKLSDAQIRRMGEAFYYRYWRLHLDCERRRLFDRPKMERRAA
jgi:hypothetical protein